MMMVMVMVMVMMMMMMMMMVNAAIPPLIGWCWHGMIRSSPVWPEDLPEDDETCRLRGPWFGLHISSYFVWIRFYFMSMYVVLWFLGKHAPSSLRTMPYEHCLKSARLGRAMVCLWSLPQLDPKAWSMGIGSEESSLKPKIIVVWKDE